MVKNNKKKGKLKQKLTNKYRLVVLNENTFEERFSLKLSRLNFYIFGGLFSVTLILATILLIAFTPLKEYFRGYTSIELRENAVENSMKLDSLENLYLAQSNYIKSLKNILSGNVSFDEIKENTSSLETNQVELEIVKTNKEDSLLRALVDEEDKYNALEIEGERFTTVLFPPVKGELSSGFDYDNKHYGVDIAMPENSPVHSISEGIVVFAEWTSETGFVIIAEHLNGLTSIYKHNSSIVKSQGDRIQTGEIIAFTGNTGSLTTGPHLHFELWYQGEPVDPKNYIEF